ncbi:anion permease, partial [Escherichia coli]|uniref:anion permease n=1 Tax=Escherichia coli TaxID=562 RepID=UPI002108679E
SLADLTLAAFTPSTTARSAGTIYRVIRNLPALYGCCPHSESARKIGAYLMWSAVRTTCVTSSFFLSALAPN